jgi:hypothetical protein
MNEKDLIELGAMVATQAQEIFATCGAESDFCVQNVGTNAVFGGTNRLIWHPKHGFRPDRGYCTERFLREFDAHFGK